MLKKYLKTGFAIGALMIAGNAFAQSSDPTEAKYRELYKELVETNTTLSAGDCTLAATRMANRLKAASFEDGELRIFSVPEHPKEGGLVATLKGSDKNKKPILLLAHIDVVEAKREDWTRDPFTLIEENGYFYARGTVDDKAMASIFTDSLIRYKQEKYKPKRTIKMALTCGEETSGSFNGAKYLSQNHKDWIDAEFALNEGAGGALDKDGNRIMLNVQAGEKVYQDFTIEATNPGGHSSQPVPKNAIYDIADALRNVSKHEFPVMLNDANREYFKRLAKIKGGEIGDAMNAIVANPNDEKANALLSQNKTWHSMLRTTCVATMINGGHALNALPQHVSANVNCRIFPGVSVESIQQSLQSAINDPQIKVSIVEPRSIATPTPKLPDYVLKAMEKVAGEIFPNTPVVPVLTTGATDAIYTNAAGIPTYGFSGLFGDPDGNGIHGLNERVKIKSLMDARKMLYTLVKYFGEN